jgi:alkanesulfonate monooxygenase SsuD/methylene tetrahydromethanopterin reductase-like flavin-dependent oxidoreductase (luciferase family)
VHQTHPSPQRTPVLFQAGASKAGISFGGKHAEAIFCSHSSIAATKKYTSSVRAAAAAEGRDPASIKFFLGAMVFLGQTIEEAQAKFERARRNCSIEGGLARFSDFVNVDMSVFPQDEPFCFEGKEKENAIHGAVESMKVVSDSKEITPRDVGEMLALGGLGCRPIGTPEMVADELIRWAEDGDVDGFNLASVVLPQSWEDVVDLLVPELQKRGVYWTDYEVPGGTLRENVSGRPGGKGLDEKHPGARFKWDRVKTEDVGGGNEVLVEEMIGEKPVLVEGAPKVEITGQESGIV